MSAFARAVHAPISRFSNGTFWRRASWSAGDAPSRLSTAARCSTARGGSPSLSST
ncbi:MAG TPA: hypothetical protein VFL83_06715 [Anaeromyxobacter sp.]|nr:hypothetical protein [Anaeromyxobacter sp.]